MNVLKFADKEFAARLTQLAAASSLFDPVVEERARGIIAAVRERGDAALLELTERFDGAQLTAEQLAVSQAELFSAAVTAEVSAMPQSLSPIRLGTKAGSSSVPMAEAKPEAAWMISSKAGRARQGPSWPKPVATA